MEDWLSKHPDDMLGRQALAETAVYPIRHRVVRSLALEMSAKGKTARAKTEALLTFVQEFVLDSYTADPMTVLDVLAYGQTLPQE